MVIKDELYETALEFRKSVTEIAKTNLKDDLYIKQRKYWVNADVKQGHRHGFCDLITCHVRADAGHLGLPVFSTIRQIIPDRYHGQSASL
jgi:hypothetical protein